MKPPARFDASDFFAASLPTPATPVITQESLETLMKRVAILENLVEVLRLELISQNKKIAEPFMPPRRIRP